MATKPTLSREYVYVPLTDMNFVVGDLTVNAMAFMSAGVEPTVSDWNTALKVTAAHAIYEADIGESLALLVGPTRGDSVTTEDLAVGDYQVWIDTKVTGSDERVVRVAGTLTVSQTGV